MFNAEYERETWISKKILVIPEKSNVTVKVTKSVGLNFKKLQIQKQVGTIRAAEPSVSCTRLQDNGVRILLLHMSANLTACCEQ